MTRETPSFEEPPGLVPRLEIGRQSLFRLVEIDRQRKRLDFRQTHELDIEQAAVGSFDTLSEGQDRDPIGDPKRMVGDDDERAIRHGCEPICWCFDLKPGLDHFEQVAPHARSPGAFGTPAMIDFQEPATAGQVLDSADKPAPDWRGACRCVAQFVGGHVELRLPSKWCCLAADHAETIRHR